MRVRMKTHITGYRNGVEWPEVGGVVELPDAEAEDLIANRYADPVPDDEADVDVVDEDVWPKHVGGSTWELPDGTRVRGKAKAVAAYDEWVLAEVEESEEG